MKTAVYDSLSSKNSGRHPECGVDAPVIVVVDMLVNRCQHLARCLEAVEVAEFLLETTKEGFNIAVLPG